MVVNQLDDLHENIETEMAPVNSKHILTNASPAKLTRVSPFELMRETQKLKSVLEKECGKFHRNRDMRVEEAFPELYRLRMFEYFKKSKK